MTDARTLKTATDRNIKAMSLRPSIARGTATTTVSVRQGETACEIEDGSWKLVADMDAGMGGAAAGPDPGILARGALGACLAAGYLLWAARLEIPIDDIRVVIETDYDARGMYGVDEAISPGWQALRYAVSITSSAPEGRVREVVELADRHSPILADITRPIPATRTLCVAAPAEA